MKEKCLNVRNVRMFGMFDWRKGALCLLSVAAMGRAWGVTTHEVVTTLETGISNQTYTVTILYAVEETIGARIVQPRFPVDKPPYYVKEKGFFLGYYGKFQTSDSGEEEVEFKVFDMFGASVGFLPGVVLPPAPTTLSAKWSLEEGDTRDNTEPIIFVCARFFASKNANLLEESNNRIAADPADWEAYIWRAFARIATLWKDTDVKFFATGCNLSFDPETGRMRRGGSLDTGILEEVRTNQKMDKICDTAVPVFKKAINDLDQLPKDWPGYMRVSRDDGYEVNVDETIYLDYADAQLLKAVFCEVISFLNLVRGYRDPDTGLPGGTNPEALEEARAWWVTAAEQVNAFNIAQRKRTDFGKFHFFELNGPECTAFDLNVQKLLDLPYWTVRVELMDFRGAAFRNKDRKDFLIGKRLDISLRSLFEGKVSLEQGTFPVFWGNGPYLDTLPDSTCGGMFPGLSRTMFGEYVRLFGFVYPFAASDEVKEYAVRYQLPKGAKNNPENPATFAADLKSAITLLPPTLEGYKFTGWSHDGVLPAGTKESLTFTATFEPKKPSGVMIIFR